MSSSRIKRGELGNGARTQKSRVNGTTPFGFGVTKFPSWLRQSAIPPVLRYWQKGEFSIQRLKLWLKRRIVSDDIVEPLSHSFMDFRSMVLVTCEGFITEGFVVVARGLHHGRVRRDNNLTCDLSDDFLPTFGSAYMKLNPREQCQNTIVQVRT